MERVFPDAVACTRSISCAEKVVTRRLPQCRGPPIMDAGDLDDHSEESRAPCCGMFSRIWCSIYEARVLGEKDAGEVRQYVANSIFFTCSSTWRDAFKSVTLHTVDDASPQMPAPLAFIPHQLHVDLLDLTPFS